MQSNKLFREKSIKKISSPEQIDDYIRITTPSVWLILFAVVILLVGLVIWGIFGRITVETAAGIESVAPISYILR